VQDSVKSLYPKIRNTGHHVRKQRTEYTSEYTMAESDHHALKAKDIVEDVSINLCMLYIIFLSGDLNNAVPATVAPHALQSFNA